MTVKSLGKINSVTPGTIVQVSATQIMAAWVKFRAFPGSTGKTFVGLTGMVKATGAAMLAAFQTPAAGQQCDEYSIFSGGGNTIDLSRLYIDADTANDGVVVSYGEQ